MKLWILLFGLVVSGCANQVPTKTSNCGDQSIKGSPSDVKTFTFEDARRGKAETCEGEDGAFYPITVSGSRMLVLRKQISEPLLCGIDELPTDAECTQVHINHFSDELAARLTKRGIRIGGIGLGACGDATVEANAWGLWNLSVSVHDWRDVDPASEEVAKLMKEWSIGRRFGVSVLKPVCAIPL